MQQCGPHDYGIDVGACGCPPGGDPRPIVSRMAQEIERLRAIVERVEALIRPDLPGVPPDGSYVVASYEGGFENEDATRVWLRDDEGSGLTPFEHGEWWVVGENSNRSQWGEVIAHDSPREDRPHVSLEVLVSADDIAQALAGEQS